MTEFKLATADLGNGVSSVSVAGEIDLSNAPELKDSVLVDLSDATFIDSTTLGVLMGAVKRVRPGGGELAIVCHDQNIRKIFEITLLDRIFNIFDSAGAGVAHLKALEGGTPPARS